MTTIAQPVPSAPRGRHGSPGAPRLAIAYVTCAACVPYIVLKLIWLFGGNLGVNDPGAMHSTKTQVANVITFALDTTTILIVLAFTYGWGRRLPSWLVVVPIWVGTGLLAPLTLAVPLGTVVQFALGEGSPTSAPGASMLDPWVFVVVYGGFIMQAAGLTIAFVLYARARWPEVFALLARDVPAGPTDVMRRFLVWAAAVPMAFAVVVDLYWAFGGTGGRTVDLSTTQQVVQFVHGSVALAGAAGALALVQRRRGRLIVPMTAAWIGGGAGFSYGLFTCLVAADPDTSTLMGLEALASMLGGLVIGLAGASLLAERAAERASGAGSGAERAAGRGRDGQSASPTASSTP
ncbi:hypothetical protein DZF91_26880 [Actinomadura logoneensis]|uniref:Uncharacterized protein n=1 Tax=Actinomadura logoneensis TaxID=2293572 RepID=A0A372JGV8_9ACTN|nr:hypothetical protein [Actinomadura logoneensis]RFU38588.1 hypothetical protein DZF91_26880 [Actinomadura logoneensis]